MVCTEKNRNKLVLLAESLGFISVTGWVGTCPRFVMTERGIDALGKIAGSSLRWEACLLRKLAERGLVAIKNDDGKKIDYRILPKGIASAKRYLALAKEMAA